MARPPILGSILINMLKKHHLLSVSELVMLLSDEIGKKYNKTSIYRALARLEGQGAICQHMFSTDETKYELRQNHHDHLVCSSCGQVQLTVCPITISQTINDFQVGHYHLTIFGLCSECQKKTQV
jgi:Fe2+ or Zn2+ uptake regulation protein